MFKVLFADDEPRMLRALEKMIDWEELGLEIVGCAGDGIEALELIREKKPDIAITDIRMPGLDGLEIAEKCASDSDRPEFIMLTGYSEFEYVRRAMKSGAARYLLKPLDTDELRETVTEICEEISRRRERERETEEAVKYVIQDTFVRICFGNRSGELLGRAAFLLGCGEGTPLYMMLFRMCPMSYEELDAVTEQMTCALPRDGVCVFAIGTRTAAVVSIESVERTAIEAAEKYYTGIYKARLDGLADLANAYHMAVMSFKRLKEGVIVIEDNIPPVNDVTGKNAGEVMELIISGKKDAAIERVGSDIKKIARERKEYSPEYAVALLMRMNGYCEPDGINIETMFENTLLALDNTSDYDTLTYLCVECIEEFTKSALQTKKMNTAVLTRRILDYINRNYTKPMTQADVARSANVNTGMVSRIIKKSTGMKYNDYLNEMRIRKAAQLIGTTDIQVSQLVNEVGYKDYYYFVGKFKEVTGMSPSEYRRKQSGREDEGDE